MLQTRTASPKPTIEYRTFDVRALDEAIDGFDGHASTFWAVDSYKTAMAPGAFKRTIQRKGDRRLVLWNHDPDSVIGKTTALKEDKVGLNFSASISTGVQRGAESMTLLRDEVPLGMSFGFYTTKERSAEDTDPLDFSQQPGLKSSDVRVITAVDLWEVSLVTFPANEAATISAVRSDRELDALSTFLESIKSGELDEAHTALMEEFADAWAQRVALAAAEQNAAVSQNATPEQARRRYAEFNALLFKCDLVQEMIR
jgi:uncharacterized protein